MSYFEDALEFTLKAEGGWSDRAADRGGKTNFGVTQATYDDFRKRIGKPKRSVREIEEPEKLRIYREGYWEPIPGIDAMPRDVAMVLFDISVNSGPGRARQWLREIGQDAKALIARRRRFFAAIIANDPSQKANERGWDNRVKNLEAAIAEPAKSPASVSVIVNGIDRTVLLAPKMEEGRVWVKLRAYCELANVQFALTKEDRAIVGDDPSIDFQNLEGVGYCQIRDLPYKALAWDGEKNRASVTL